MKRFLLVLAALLAAGSLSAAPTIHGVTDAYILAGPELVSNVGQDINLDWGPFFLDLTADWARAATGADTMALTYAVGFSKAFGPLTPGLKLTGDQTYPLDNLTSFCGDWLSDLEPTVDMALGPFGVNLYGNLSFERGYDLLQTMDFSAFLKFKIAELRAGYLFMTDQAVTDDVGYPHAPAAVAGHSFYAKVSVSY